MDGFINAIRQFVSRAVPQTVTSPLPQYSQAEDNAVAQMQQAAPQDSKAQLYSLYQRYGNAVVPQTTPTPTLPPPAAPTPTPFQENNLVNGYVSDTPKNIVPVIAAASKQYGIPTSLLSSLLSHESMHFNPDVIAGNMTSPVGAQGIAQFMPETSQGMGVNPLDVNSAIPGAARLLRSHYEALGNRPDLALAAYNAGMGNVQKYGGIPPFNETINYVKNIMNDANNAVPQ